MVDYIIKQLDSERIIRSPTPDTYNINRFIEAVNLALIVFPEGKGKVQIEDPKIPYKEHHICIDVYDEDFEDERLENFATLLNKCDSVSFFGTGELRMMLQIQDLYKGNP